MQGKGTGLFQCLWFSSGREDAATGQSCLLNLSVLTHDNSTFLLQLHSDGLLVDIQEKIMAATVRPSLSLPLSLISLHISDPVSPEVEI